MKFEILSIRASIGLKEDDSSNGKDVGHSEQQDRDEYHRLHRGRKQYIIDDTGINREKNFSQYFHSCTTRGLPMYCNNKFWYLENLTSV